MIRLLLIAALFASLPLRAEAAPVKVDHVEAELVAEHDALVPGGDNWLALRLKPDEGWHVYWQNPGDSGLPTQLLWQAVDGAEAGELHWPYPEVHTLGELTNYGYGQETLHLLPLRVKAAPGTTLSLRAQAKWLVCKDVCIPGSAQLALDLPVRSSAQPDARWQAAFTDMRTRLPRMMPEWSARFAVNAQDFSLQVDGPGLDDSARFFPLAGDLIAHSAPQRLQVQDGTLRLTQTLSPYFVDAPAAVEGVLVLGPAAQARAYRIMAAPGEVAALPAATSAAAAAPTLGPAWVLLFAILGGLILNLMPCVFPVLSLKALAVMQAREQSAGEQRRHALAYTAGVMLSCGAVAALLLGLRAGGEALGWGFQLQSPAFVGLLAYLMFLLGLSLSGALEIGTRWMGVGQSLTQGHSARSSFFTGVLATVVASPCTAPFMGTALGYALTQSAFISLSIFLALGFGLALPFLLLGFAPRLAALLPRPGAWMETFKQLMAFPLYLTAVWLLWVLTRQAGANAGALLLCGAVLIAFAVWLWRREGVASRALRYAALAAALALLAHPALRASAAPTATAAEVGTEAYSDARFEQLRAEGRTVFVNLTADWCITCKVNERAVIDTERMRSAFAERDVVHLVGDWTRSDPALTAVLERYGRSGVPLYLVSVAGGEPQVLPQILTPDVLIESLTP